MKTNSCGRDCAEIRQNRARVAEVGLAKKIDADRTLLQVGLDNIERWAKLHGGLPRAHEEWRNLIEGEPWEKLRDMLIEESDEGQRLRSSSPFAGIVTPAERERILAAKGEPRRLLGGRTAIDAQVAIASRTRVIVGPSIA